MDDADNRRLWLSYHDLAVRLGVKVESARKTVQRKRWPRKTNNRGETLVGVPLDVLPPEGQSPVTVSPDSPETVALDRPETVTPDAGPAVMLAIATLAGQIERLEAELAATKGERDAHAAAAFDFRAEIATLRAVVEAEKARAGELKDERDEAIRLMLARRRWWPFRRSA